MLGVVIQRERNIHREGETCNQKLVCVCVRERERDKDKETEKEIEREAYLLILPHFHGRILIPEVLKERVKHVVKCIHDLRGCDNSYIQR
jgi:hypothetical protein